MSEFAGVNDVEMSLNDPEVEIEDVHGLIKELENHIQESKERNAEMERLLEKIKDNISKQDELNQRRTAIDAAAGKYSEKLTPTAVELISNTEGPLTAENFLHFLMNDTVGKPNPPVLPILRKYSRDVEGTKKQLIDFKRNLKSKHKSYMDERKTKEENLERRITTLVENIDKEMKVETRDGRVQIGMDNFLERGS